MLEEAAELSLPNNNLPSHMNKRTKVITIATLTMAFALPGFTAQQPGQVDFGTMPSAKGRQFVEVNIEPNLIALAAKITSKQQPEVADLLKGIKLVRVNVVGMDDSNRETVAQKIQAVRDDLAKQGWTPVVTVRDENGQNVNVHLKTGENDVIQGLVVTVLDNKNEAVFVNIVGDINPDKIAAIANRFDIEPLKKLHLEEKTE